METSVRKDKGRMQAHLQGAMADYSKAIDLDLHPALAYANRRCARKAMGDSMADGDEAPGALVRQEILALPGIPPYRYISREPMKPCLFSRARLVAAVILGAPIAGGAPDVEKLLEDGRRKFEAGDYAGAVAECTRVLELEPANAAAYTARAGAKVAQRDLTGAIADATKAIELVPTAAVPYNTRSCAKYLLNDVTGALADAMAAIRLKGDYAEAHLSRGSANLSLGRLNSALVDCTEAIRLNPRLALAYATRGGARLGRGDLQGALGDCNHALELDPQCGAAHFNRARTKDVRGDYAGAMEDYDRAIECGVDTAIARYNRANHRVRFGNIDGANADIARSLELDATFASAYVTRGIVQLIRGNVDAAIADLDRAISLDPNNAVAYARRGDAKKARGDRLGAMDDLEKALVLQNPIRRDPAPVEDAATREPPDPETQYKLFVMYSEGNGVPESEAEAIKWCRAAAEQGYDIAQFRLAGLYAHGNAADLENAAAFYRKAAEQGHALAQLALGRAYEHGRGVPQNLVLAHLWYSIAVQNKANEARDSLSRVESKMSAEQRAEATAMERDSSENLKSRYKYSAPPP